MLGPCYLAISMVNSLLWRQHCHRIQVSGRYGREEIKILPPFLMAPALAASLTLGLNCGVVLSVLSSSTNMEPLLISKSLRVRL